MENEKPGFSAKGHPPDHGDKPRGALLRPSTEQPLAASGNVSGAHPTGQHMFNHGANTAPLPIFPSPSINPARVRALDPSVRSTGVHSSPYPGPIGFANFAQMPVVPHLAMIDQVSLARVIQPQYVRRSSRMPPISFGTTCHPNVLLPSAFVPFSCSFGILGLGSSYHLRGRGESGV